MLSFVIYVLFAASLAFDVWTTKKMKENGELPTRKDYFFSALPCLVGIMFFTGFSSEMATNPTKGIAQAVIGIAAISVSIWVLSTYKRLERHHRY